MVEDASDYLWKNFGISVGTPDYMWSKDQTIEEATKKDGNLVSIKSPGTSDFLVCHFLY